VSNDVTAEVGGGFWVNMKVREVPRDDGRPQGIQYALTLHRLGGHRILGYDNAHKPKIGTGPSRRSKQASRGFDHRHWRKTISIYDYVSPAKLLEDFWADVYALLEEEGIP
jgi:hypothetical protein